VRVWNGSRRLKILAGVAGLGATLVRAGLEWTVRHKIQPRAERAERAERADGAHSGKPCVDGSPSAPC